MFFNLAKITDGKYRIVERLNFRSSQRIQHSGRFPDYVVISPNNVQRRRLDNRRATCAARYWLLSLGSVKTSIVV